MGRGGAGGRAVPGEASAPLDARAALRGTVGAAPRTALLAAGVLAAAVLLAFRGSLANGLVDWDDDIYLRRIPELHGWGARSVVWMLTDTSWFYWHPLNYLLLAAGISVWGGEPRPFHAAGLFLHAANAVLVLLLFAVLLAPRGGAGRRANAAAGEGPAAAARPEAVVTAAGLAALLWALHPLRVEPVAWIAETKELLSAFFLLLSTLAWLVHGSTPPGGPRVRWYAASFALWFLALASKPTAVAAPVVFLVLDALLLGRARAPGAWKGLLREKVPFLVLGAAAAIYGASGDKEQARASTPLRLGAGDRVLTPLWGLAAPLVRTAWPSGLSPLDPQFSSDEIHLGNPRYLLSLLLLAGIAWFAASRRRRGERWWAAALLAYLAAVAPVSGVRQLAGIATADRFSYLPTLPLYALAGAGVLAAARRSAAAWIAPAAAAALLAALSAGQVGVWRDPETLWTRVLREWPDRVPVAHDNLGSWYLREGLRHGDRALVLRAREEYGTAIRLAGNDPGAENNLGRIGEALEDPAEAERHYRRAVELAPGFSFARMNLARLLARRGRREEAERQWREALERGGSVDPAVRAEVERLLGRGGDR